MLDLAQLLRVPTIDPTLGFDISQDGQRVAFSWNKTGRWEIYELDLRASDSPRLVSVMQGAKFSPKYSPDGIHLAYALDMDGSESFHIILHNLKSNSTIDLTPQSGYAQQPNFDFSPDGKSLAILCDENGQFALYFLTIETKEKNLLLDVHRPIWDVSWSPDGKWIAIEAESVASDRSIYIVSSDGEKTFQLKIDSELLNAEHPAWSPDSKYVAFCGENGEWHNIGLFEIESQRISWVTHSAGDDSQPAWSQDGECLGWVHSEGAKTNFQFKKGSGPVNQVQTGEGFHSFPKFIGDNVILLYEDSNHPTDLWKINLENGSKQQLTKSIPNELKINFVQPEELCYKSMDGADVPALLYRGDGTKAVIDIHGGPNWHVQYLWNPILSYMASCGWTVLIPNYRGSTGYGKKWQNASRYDMGGVDTRDCAAGVRYLVENGLAPAGKNKIAVTGRSHGGFLTMCCLTFYPDLFAGGSAVVPFLNWIKSHYESREDLQHWNIENMGDPEENKERWMQLSPYFFLDKVIAPVQMICGGNDPRCPASDSIDARDKLVELGKEVELLLYEDEGHSFMKMENIIDSETKRMEFLGKCLNT